MKSVFLMTVCAAAALLLAVTPDSLAKKPARIRVGTYNLRRAPLDAKDPVNNWKTREPRLIQSILDCQFDICGLQEVDSDEQESVPRMLAERGVEYGSYFFGPYADDGHGTKAHGVLWRKDRFSMVDGPHYFWISNPPDQKQVNDTGINGKHKFIRGGFCVTLKERKTGRKYFMMVTHGPLNKQQHSENARVFIDMEKKYNPKGYPSFFVGDFNARETDEASAVYRTWWTDSYHYFDNNPSDREGPFATFNGWKQPDPASSVRIDFIYYRGKGITPLHYTCNDARIDGYFASDHFPVYVDFLIK